MIRTEQQYEELNRIKPVHFLPPHFVARAIEVRFAETFASLSRIR